MKQLRSDLDVAALPNNALGCEIHDPESGETYEFGSIEQFLIEQFRHPYKIDEVCSKCNSQFGLQYTNEDISEFLGLLAKWKLLREEDGPSDGSALSAGDKEDKSEKLSSEYTKYLDRPNRWHLFNPQSLLDGLNRLLQPVHFMIWLVPVVFTLGVITVMHNFSAFLSDVSKVSSSFGFFGKLILSTFTVNIVSQAGRGLVARYHGLAAPSLGIWLELGLIPRFNLQIIPKGRLTRRTRLWLSATPTLVRLWLFGVGILMWLLTRPSLTLSAIGAELAFVSFIGLAFSANPLWRGDGVNFLSALLDYPDLRERSHGAFWRLFVKRPAAIERHSRRPIALGLFGLFSILFFLAVFGFIAYSVFHSLETRYQGVGAALFLLLSAYVSFTIHRNTKAKKNQGRASSGKRFVASQTGSGSLSRWVKYSLLVIFIVCLFLPYRYETSGTAEVLPSARVTLSIEQPGVVDEVHFNGGEWVKAGTTLARLSYYKQFGELRATEAKIEAKRYEIAKNQTTPSTEEIRLAENKILTVKMQARYSEEKLKRQEQLFLLGFVSQQSRDDTWNAAEHDKKLLAEAEASLLALKAEVNPNQIKSLNAEMESLQHNANLYQEQVRRTYLISPIDGQIVTKDLQFLSNSYMKEGAVFAQIENTRTVLVRVAVPESDSNGLALGAELTLTLWAHPNREFKGTVTAIAPNAEEDSNKNRIVYVTSSVPNPDGILRSGLTGFAKVAQDRTIVLLAFTKAFIRFVAVEAWSWLP